MRQNTLENKTQSDWEHMRKLHVYGDEQIRLLWDQVRGMADNDDVHFSPDDLISIPSALTEHKRLMIELSQPTFSESHTSGKLIVDKKPDGARSPNEADAVVIAFAPIKIRRSFWDV